MAQAPGYLEYWIVSLKDANAPTIDLDKENSWNLPAKDLIQGTVPLETVRGILKAKKDRAGNAKDRDEHSAKVLISPLLLKPVFDHAAVVDSGRNDILAPFWIPAIMKATAEPAELLPNGVPWASRDYLKIEDSVDPSVPTVGSMKAKDDFLTSDPPKEDETSWEDFFGYAKRLFKATCGLDPEDKDARLGKISIDGYRAFVEPKIILDSGQRGIDKPIRELYERMVKVAAYENKSLPPLIEGLVSAGESEPFEPAKESAKRKTYLGHPVSSFPMAEAQRAVVLAATSLKRGETLAVNGPPGTGKTTLLQSLVASFWVERALGKGEPPVILACSTNNQAVTNILRAFTLEEDDRDPIARRWIPEPVAGYGMCMPSSSKKGKGEAAQYPWVSFWGSNIEGLPSDLEKIEYGRSAAPAFVKAGLEQFPELPKKEDNLEQIEAIVERLHQELELERDQLEDLRERAFRLVDERRVWADAGFRDPIDAVVHYVAKLQAATEKVEARRRLKREVDDRISNLPLWLDLLAPIFGILRERRDYFLGHPFRQAELDPPSLPRRAFRGTLEEHVGSLHRVCLDEQNAVSQELNAAKNWEEMENSWVERIQGCLLETGRHPDELVDFQITRDGLINDPPSIDRLLDLSSRWRLFHLAARYWEGRWIRELRDSFDDNPYKLRCPSRMRIKARFRRYCKITPLLVATFHRASTAFRWYEDDNSSGPLTDYLDLLIVDEAGIGNTQKLTHPNDRKLTHPRPVCVLAQWAPEKPNVTFR